MRKIFYDVCCVTMRIMMIIGGDNVVVKGMLW